MEDIWDPILSEADKTFVRLDFFPPLPTCEVKAPRLICNMIGKREIHQD